MPETTSSGPDADRSEVSSLAEIDRILVAVDFSEFSQRALQSALVLADRLDAELHQVHVTETSEDGEEDGADPSDEKLRSRMVEMTRSAVEATRSAEGQVRPEELTLHRSVIRESGAAPALLAYVYEHHVDLVVTGTHGRRGLRRLILGSVAEELIHHAPCPVLIVREEALSTRPGRLLVPVDFSEHSERALSYARRLADRSGSEIELLYVVEDLPTPSFLGQEIGSIYDVEPEIEERAVEHLEELWKEGEGPDVPHTAGAVPGPAPSTIIDLAEEHDCDAIVMATHGRTGVDRFLLGSVADRVVRSASCPVLVVRTREMARIKRVHVQESVLESDWYAELSEADRELVRYFVGRTAEVLSHTDESTKLVLNLVATNNRYIHVPNEFVREFD